jgi:DNA-binding IclR family transcriptional regulator
MPEKTKPEKFDIEQRIDELIGASRKAMAAKKTEENRVAQTRAMKFRSSIIKEFKALQKEIKELKKENASLFNGTGF